MWLVSPSFWLLLLIVATQLVAAEEGDGSCLLVSTDFSELVIEQGSLCKVSAVGDTMFVLVELKSQLRGILLSDSEQVEDTDLLLRMGKMLIPKMLLSLE